MDIGRWLDGLGLGQYGQAFADNDIDDETLRGLTAEDLRELGVTSLGHRKRLLEAIARLDAERKSGAGEAERRQVAVFFADLSGFTALSAEVGAEEVHRIVERFLARAGSIVAEHGGTVDKHIGDSIMALFGAPVAHEDDPWRAVTAAVDLQKAMPKLSAELGRPLTAHVGIALGEVVAGKIGGDVRRDYTVLGDTVNLAARLVSIAAAGEIVLGDAAWRTVASRVRATDLGERDLKGIARPQRAWRIDQLGGSVSAGRLPFTGRDVELAQARAVVTTAQPGGVLHLRGEAGIGKSRLLAEAIAIAAGQGFSIVVARNLDFGAARAQAPVRAVAEALARRLPEWLDDDTVEIALRAAASDVLERAIPGRFAVPWAAMQDATRASLRSEAVATFAAAVAAVHPLAIAIEDMHWASDATRSLTRGLARHTLKARLLVFTTSRPESDPLSDAFRRSLGRASVATIELGPLTPQATQRLAEAAAGADAAQRLAERSGGNPLFLEQLLASAAESDARALPESIRGLVQARLDRLQRGDRTALQAGAVLGQRFPASALASVAGEANYDPRPLIESGLLVRDGALLSFAHALIQEGTYASLLSEQARRLHRRAADWFGDNEPDLRAQHLERAGDPGAALAWRIAAERLRDNGRVAMALERARRGLALAADDAVRGPLQVLAGQLQLDLGDPREASAHFRAALDSAADNGTRGEAEFGMAAVLRLTDDIDGANLALDRAQAIADRSEMLVLSSRCHNLRGNLLFPLGRVAECLAEHRAALAKAERSQSPAMVARALGGLGDALYAEGRMLEASDVFGRCVEQARRHGVAQVELANRPMAALGHLYRLDLPRFREAELEAAALARQAQSARAELVARHCQMTGSLEAADAAFGLGLVGAMDELNKRMGGSRFAGEQLILTAQLEAIAGQRERGIELAREAVRQTRTVGISYVGPWVLSAAAWLTDNPSERAAWLAEGETILTGSSALSHNHHNFRRYAMDVALQSGQAAEVRRHARALEAYCTVEPCPYTDLLVQRGLLLADALEGKLTPTRRAELAELSARARRGGFVLLGRAMQAALD